MAEPTKPTHPLAYVNVIAGAAGGWALSRYAGLLLWFPSVATILLLLLFTKTPLRPKFFLGAISTTGGHVLWFLVGSFMTQIWAATALDIVILSIGILWLWLRPGLAPAFFSRPRAAWLTRLQRLPAHLQSCWQPRAQGSHGSLHLAAHRALMLSHRLPQAASRTACSGVSTTTP
jgi:hypothetical protein